MMRSIMTASMVLALSTSFAFATQKPQPQPEKPNTLVAAIAAAKARANANAVAQGGSVKNSGNSWNQNNNRNSNRNTNQQGQQQSQSANSYSGGNTISNNNSYRAAASSAYAPSGNTTAPCQKYASAGAQGMNFGFSFGLNFDSGKCWTMFRAEEYKKVYGIGVVRAYYEANDRVLAGIVAKQGPGKVYVRAKKRGCGCR